MVISEQINRENIKKLIEFLDNHVANLMFYYDRIK